MFYDNFLKLCNQKGVAPTKVAVETGGHKSDATRWKNGSTPTDARKVVIADYFGVTVEELMDGKKEKTTGAADGFRIQDITQEEVQALSTRDLALLIARLSEEMGRRE